MAGEITKRARIKVKRDTTANWNANATFIPLDGEIIIYTDYYTDDNRTVHPGMKIGDGLAYLIDLPFVTQKVETELTEHILNTTVHVTSAEKTFWNNKLNTHVDDENLVLCTYESD